MKHGPIQLLAPVGLLSLALALSSCGSTSMGLHTREALGELDGANYQRAHFEVDKALKLEPDSPALQRLWRQTRVLSLLDKARERIFEDKEELALALLEQVLVLDSSNAIAIRWRDKARQQLGVSGSSEGQESLGRGELEQALAMFREAMQLVPGNEAAERGYRDVGRIFSERRLNAEEHYQEGLRAQLDGDWYRVLYHAGISANEDPSRQDAKQLLAAGSVRWPKPLASKRSATRRSGTMVPLRGATRGPRSWPARWTSAGARPPRSAWS
jgi:tetratricopeptide (TPR) repeat protein